MQTFRKLFREKTCNDAFKALYAHECHVCPFTMRIFEQLETRQIDMTRLAADLKVSIASLMDLKDADCCDPSLVIALCRHLELEEPDVCPKL